MTTRSLKDYRPQHDERCAVNKCGNCGHWSGDPTMHGFGDPCDDWGVQPCDCGLDTLLAQPLASEGATPPGTPQQTHAETLEQVAHRFVAYWTKDRSPSGKGCGMCGGIPHSTTCFVGRMEAALRAPVGTCETCQCRNAPSSTTKE